ncbi:MAG: diphthine synthase [Thaumarchaeota archaeon]|nr:MAG: diphthine synthase [Nitrososphaerota archaeon]
MDNMPLYLIGIGLGSRGYITREALDAMSRSEKIYLDTYTSILDDDLLQYLRENFSDKLIEADRKLLEDEASKIVEEARLRRISIAVPGDPLIATTHIAILIEAAKRRIPYRIIYGVSAYSALISASGLQAYKFGRTTTIPRDGVGIETCYNIILENMERGLHTLVLLDTAGGGLEIPEAIKMLYKVEEKYGEGLISENRLIICLARIGFKDEFKWAGRISDAIDLSYPPPPHTMIFPGSLHFSEADALREIYGVDSRILESHNPIRFWTMRLAKYISNVEHALKTLKILDERREVNEVLNLSRSYLEDSIRFRERGRLFDSLAAISYSEGLLDSLRILRAVEFSWRRENSRE